MTAPLRYLRLRRMLRRAYYRATPFVAPAWKTRGHTTLVSAYFEIRSKFSHDVYEAWMRNFLKIRTPMVVFTDRPALLRQLRGELPLHVVEQHLDDFRVARYRDRWPLHHRMDPERERHSIDLYMVWNEKPEFVRRAIELDPFRSDYFCWTDIGAFRDSARIGAYLDFPRRCTNRVLLNNVEPFRTEESCSGYESISDRFLAVNRIGGGIFCGRRDYLLDFHRRYYDVLDEFFRRGIFAGKDQSIMATVALLHPEVVHLVSPRIARFDPWFYLQEFLTFDT